MRPRPPFDPLGDERRPAAARGAGRRPSARAARSRAAHRGSAGRCRRSPSRRARSKPRRELVGLTPGMPGSQRSSEPCRTSRRLPRSVVELEAVGQPRREPEDGLDPGRVGAPHGDRAAHREAEQERPRCAGGGDRCARVLHTRVERVPRLHPVAHLGEGDRREARRDVATSHSSEALHVPATRSAWPPLTQTTVASSPGR